MIKTLPYVAGSCPRRRRRFHCIEMLDANPVPVVQRTLLGTPAYQHVFKMYSLSNACSMFCLVFSICLFCFSVKQVSLASLQDVINYFVTQTQGNLKPFVMGAYHNALQTAHSSESKTQKSPAEGQRHKEELTGTPLLQLSWKHFPCWNSVPFFKQLATIFPKIQGKVKNVNLPKAFTSDTSQMYI